MKYLFRVIQFALLLVLPFFLLVRLSVYLHSVHGLFAWVSIGVAAGATIVLLTFYFTFIYGWIAGKLGSWKAFKRRGYLAGFVVWGFCIYGLIFLSGENVKHDEIRKEYLSLHPVLRIGVSTLVLVDQGLIVTDASRQPEDYKSMGLPSKSRSLHYEQSSGFVHAIDVRTNGRSEFRNNLLRFTFRVMGFNTLRHGGTGDHLHISLKSHDTPGAI